jgi:hypothetical protein
MPLGETLIIYRLILCIDQTIVTVIAMEIHGRIQILRRLRFIVCVLVFHSMIGFTPDSLYRTDYKNKSQIFR